LEKLASLKESELCKKTALVKHIYINEHHVNWQDSKILCFENDYFKRHFVESFYSDYK